MHFSIPDLEVFTKDKSNFTGFNIYINGSFHCCLRYKQLHSLHEQLKKSLTNLSLPQFPPKKLLTLTANELEQRRLSLERYLQLVGQDPVLSKSNLLRTFLLNAQQESAFTDAYETTIDVFLMNGFCIKVQVSTTECSSKVLEKALKAVEISDNAIFFFALFLLRRNADGSLTLVRKLMDFESPFISLRNASDCEIVIRKNYWDESFDLDLMHNRIAMNLLHIQAISDVERSWIATNSEIRQKLNLIQNVGNKNDYMAIVRGLPYYGTLHFSNVNCDFPELKTNASIIIGNSELIIKTVIGVNQYQETKFRVTRMRSWRITTIHNEAVAERRIRINENHKSYTFELSFEYLMAKNSLRWIKLVTEQAMLISVCLQSMVDELLNQKNGYDVNNIQYSQTHDQQLQFIRRDDSSNSGMSNSTSDGSIDSEMRPIIVHRNGNNSGESRARVKKKVSTSVFFKSGKESVQNEAFENIGDDDL